MTAIVHFFALLMDACHRLVPNHWADIVLFTFLTKILQYPVSLWCQANSLKMVSLLPRTIRLKLDHYGDNDTIGEKPPSSTSRKATIPSSPSSLSPSKSSS